MKTVNVRSLAIRNLKHRKSRTAFMIAFVFILSASLFVSGTLITNMASCMEQTAGRIGANIVVVPADAAPQYKEFFTGGISTFFFEKDLANEIDTVKGVEAVTSQMFISTLAASCCSNPLQVVGYEPETDFVVKPWLAEGNSKEPKDGEIVVGYNVYGTANNTLKLYGIEYKIVGRLERTQTAYDDAVFMTRNTAYELTQSPTFPMEIDNPQEMTSLVLVRTKEGSNNTQVTAIINRLLKGKGPLAYESTGMLSNLQSTMKQLKTTSAIVIVLLFIMSILSLICVFNITVGARSGEFGIMLSTGANKSFVTKMLLWEAGLIGLVGGVSATILSAAGMVLFSDVIGEMLSMKFMHTSVTTYLTIGVICIVVALVTSLIATMYGTIRVGKSEPYKLVQEGAA